MERTLLLPHLPSSPAIPGAFPSSVVSGDRALSWEAGGLCSRSVCPWASPFLLGLHFPTCHGIGKGCYRWLPEYVSLHLLTCLINPAP